jgi:integrase
MAKRTAGDGGLYKRKDGIWVGAVELPKIDGKRRTKTVSSKDRNVAMDKLKKMRRDVEDGRIAVTGKATVAQWLERWITDIHGPTIRPTTKVSYQTCIRLYIVPAIGSKRLEKLLPQDVRDMHRHASATSQRAAQKSHVILQRALSDAVNEGLIVRNVASVVHKPRHTGVQRDPLTADQAKLLLRVAINDGDVWATRWAAALLLGARQGELLGLQWNRVDLDAGLIDLSWQLQQLQQTHGCGEKTADGFPCGKVRVGFCPQRHWNLPPGFEYVVLHRSIVLTRPKTQAGYRVVPLPLPLWEMLRRMPQAETNPHGLVWHHEDGRPLGPRDDYGNWQEALTAAELPAAPLHVARHTTATLLLEAGVSEQVRMQILGHTSVQVTRGYAHVDQKLAREAMRSLDNLLSTD